MLNDDAHKELIHEYMDRVVTREESQTLQDEAIATGQAFYHYVDRLEAIMKLRAEKGKTIGWQTRETAEWVSRQGNRLGRLIEIARAAATKDDI